MVRVIFLFQYVLFQCVRDNNIKIIFIFFSKRTVSLKSLEKKMKNGSRLLKVLLQASEKAANIARICRQKEALFQLLVQEKSLEEKNPRFFQDFKTLADVLIQETIRHDIEIEVRIKGF